jgi:hypothetical protein
LLDRRAAAVVDRDRRAFMATLSPGADAFRSRQAQSFEWMQAVDFASYELEVEWESLGDLATPKDINRYSGAEAVSIAVVEERYRIRGYDRDHATEDLVLTFVRRDGSWSIADDTDLDELGLFSARKIWDFGPLYSARSEHFLLFGHPCGAPGAPSPCTELGADFLALAEAGLDRLGRYWPPADRMKVIVIVPGSTEELKRMLQATFDPENFVAFAYTTIDEEDGETYTAPRIIFNHNSLQARSSDDVASILTHELLHVATRPLSGPYIPIFIEEGFADYVGRDADPGALAFLEAQIAAGNFDSSLPDDPEFTTGDATSIFNSYQEAHSLVRFIDERWSLKRFIRFYKDLGARRSVAGTARYHLEDSLHDVFRVSFERLENLWADSIRR